MLEAVHWYRPESDDLSDLKTYTGPLAPNKLSSLLQVISGFGTPVALHLMDNAFPVTVVTLDPISTVNEPLCKSSNVW